MQFGHLATLQWDAESFRIPNHPAAHALLTNSYRPGWEVPAAQGLAFLTRLQPRISVHP